MKASLVDIKARNQVKLNKQAGILNNGADNAYPTRMERVILSSVTAKAAAEMYTNFLVGDGFEDERLNNLVVGEINYKPITMYDLLERIAHSVAYQNGVFIHTNWRYDGNGKYLVDSVQPLTFKSCRLGKQDDSNYKGKVIIYNNWDKSEGNRIEKTKFNKVDVFNANPKVIEAQVQAAQGWDKYKGQVFWKFFDNEYDYPLSQIDVAQDDADTEYQISLFKNGELNGNFFAKYIIRHAYFERDSDKQNFLEKLKEFQGGENNGALMLVEDDIEEDETGEVKDNGLKFEKIEQNINDKLFIEWEKSIANNIRKSYKAIPPVLIDYVEGSLGNTSGESLVQAANFYNEMTRKDRSIITGIFKELFENFKTPIESEFTIKRLSFGSTNNI